MVPVRVWPEHDRVGRAAHPALPAAHEAHAHTQMHCHSGRPTHTHSHAKLTCPHPLVGTSVHTRTYSSTELTRFHPLASTYTQHTLTSCSPIYSTTHSHTHQQPTHSHTHAHQHTDTPHTHSHTLDTHIPTNNTHTLIIHSTHKFINDELKHSYSFTHILNTHSKHT